MTTKHTNGPWITRNRLILSADDETGIGIAYSPTIKAGYGATPDVDTANANARLIAAAPELLRHSEQFLSWFRVFIGEEAFAEIRCDELDNLRDAIKAAKGDA